MTVDWANASVPIKRSDAPRSRQLDDDLVVYHPVTDEVSHLNPIARAVWEQLATAPTFDELVEALAEAFQAPAATIGPDVSALLDGFHTARLVALDHNGQR